jgi:hypothetical protein
MSLAVVTPYFNYMNNIHRRWNYDQHVQSIRRAGLPHLTVEFQLAGRPYDLDPSPDVMQFRIDAIKWHKTNGINIGARELLRRGFKYIMWSDADCVFPDKGWPDQVVGALLNADLVHTQSEFRFQETGELRLGWVASGLARGRDGGGWAARSSFFEEVGLFDCIVGGANKSVAIPIDRQAWKIGAEIYGEALLQYAERASKHIRSLTYIPLIVQDLNHGSRLGRNNLVRRRYAMLARHRFNFRRDCRYDAEGIIHWQNPDSELARDVAAYSTQRESAMPYPNKEG